MTLEPILILDYFHDWVAPTTQPGSIMLPITRRMLPQNPVDICSAVGVLVQLERTAIDTEVIISDDGEGIFKKIQRALKLYDERHAVLEHAFTKTVVSVRLAQYGDERLVSRSQAKRLLARVDKFRVVAFDFTGVEAIGQSFADEVFRVFRKQHLDMQIMSLNASKEVVQMISRAESTDT